MSSENSKSSAPAKPNRLSLLRRLTTLSSEKTAASIATTAGPSSDAVPSELPAPKRARVETPPASSSGEGPQVVGVTEEPELETVSGKKSGIFIGYGGVELPLPDPKHPRCQKVKPVNRWVPTPKFNFPTKSAIHKFARPLCYGASLADQEIPETLSDGDLADLSAQKLGEVLRITERLREHARQESDGRAVAELQERVSQLDLELKAAIGREEAARSAEREATALSTQLKAFLENAKGEVEEEKGHRVGLQQENEEFRTTITSLQAEVARSLARAQKAEDDYLGRSDNLYEKSIDVVCRKARARYPDAGINWKALLELTEEEIIDFSQ